MEAWETTISVVIFRTSLGIGITPYWLSGIKYGSIIDKLSASRIVLSRCFVTVGGIVRVRAFITRGPAK